MRPQKTHKIRPWRSSLGESQVLRRLILNLAVLAALQLPSIAKATELQLPYLGYAGESAISTADEYRLGQSLVRFYRASFRMSHDPFLEEYLQQLARRLLTYSELQDKRLELLIVENPSLNAFAAPGGILGINTGTFLVAETEQQLSSIVAHELAHLSQRHYARRLEQQKTNNLVSLGALLASILVATASDSKDAIAAIPAIQAASIENSLRFSREMEAEADRIGMQTMISAGLDPYAMPQMFELMLRKARFRTKVPEFLLTHPVTESRVSDSLSRARKYPEKPQGINLEYQLLRIRAMLIHEDNPAMAVKRFASRVEDKNTDSVMMQYGLVLALTKTGDYEQAQEQLEKLKTALDMPTFLDVAQADIYVGQKQYAKAIDLLEKRLKILPNSHPLNIRLAEILMEAGKFEECETLLIAHSKRHPENEYVWYLLAEVHGLAGHILEVHKARAEYFILNGIYSKAEIQLRNALKLTPKDDFHTRAKLEQRLLDVKTFQKNDIFR